MGDKVHAAIHSESATEGLPNNSYNFSMGDQMWQEGTNYGTIHGPARPIKATKSATSGPGGQPAAATTGLGDRSLHDRPLVGLCVV